MQNFLSILKSKKEKIIGVSLTPGIGLEVIEMDPNADKVVSNYARRPIEYNFSTREPQNYEKLKAALSELLDVIQAPPKTKLYFVLPNVLFDFLDLPQTLTINEIKTTVLSETEKFYLFKKDEPYSAWNEIGLSDDGQKKIVYTAFQRNVVDSIKDIAVDLGHELVGIESSYSATLKGMYACGYFDDLILEQESWTIMLINVNSYTLFQFHAQNLENYNEVPIAIKSYSKEEAYDSIVSSSSQLLSNRVSSKLFVISQTDDISAEILKKHLDYSNSIEAIDINKHSKKSLLEVLSAEDFNKANSITFSAIAASSDISKNKWSVSLNVLDDNSESDVYFTTSIFNEEIEVTDTVVQRVCLALAAICFVVFAAISGSLYFLQTSQESEKSDLDSKIADVSNKITQLSAADDKQEVDINTVIDELAKENVSVINFYDSIATDIPKNVWLTQYYNKSADKIAITGVAQSIIDVYEYYKNLRVVSPQSNIKLNELKLITNEKKEKTEDGENETKEILLDLYNLNKNARLYSFEISNLDVNLSSEATSDNSKEDDDVKLPGGYSSKTSDSVDIVKKSGQSNGGKVEETSKQMVPAN